MIWSGTDPQQAGSVQEIAARKEDQAVWLKLADPDELEGEHMEVYEKFSPLRAGRRNRMDTLDIEHYEREGWAVVEGVFSGAECEELVAHMLDLHAGKKSLAGFAPREADQLQRTHNQHWSIQSRATGLLHRRSKNRSRSVWKTSRMGSKPMLLGGIRTGSPPGPVLFARLHVGVDRTNGRRRGQRRYVAVGFAQEAPADEQRLFAEDGEFHGWDYNAAVDELCTRNAIPETPVCVRRGDVVFFDGVLVHRGGPIGKPGSYRHSLANHYIGHSFNQWTHSSWPRVSFDGSQRLTS